MRTHQEQASSRAFDLGHGTVDIFGIHEAKTEMCDATTETCRRGVFGEREDVVPSRCLCVDEPISAAVFPQTEDLLVEPKRTVKVSDRKIEMCKAVGGNHVDINWQFTVSTPRPEWLEFAS